ncbi:hypothetical protein [Paenibacillus tyrfis]|uniref:hypothetical protein n=1 Tax=Paenibacillus tyrfis TaxID=1501230 RepID=UPI000B58791B|nr:hypothetical protein [Paenibacillus tyrfis]
MNGQSVQGRNKEELLKVERYFNNAGGISFEGILSCLMKERVEELSRSSYHDEQVNVATSDEGVA